MKNLFVLILLITASSVGYAVNKFECKARLIDGDLNFRLEKTGDLYSAYINGKIDYDLVFDEKLVAESLSCKFSDTTNAFACRSMGNGSSIESMEKNMTLVDFATGNETSYPQTEIGIYGYEEVATKLKSRTLNFMNEKCSKQ